MSAYQGPNKMLKSGGAQNILHHNGKSKFNPLKELAILQIWLLDKSEL